VRVEPTRELVPEMDGSLRKVPTELSEVAGLPSCLRMLRPPELPDLPEFDERPPLSGLRALCGLAVVPVLAPCPLPVEEDGVSGLRMARGPDVPGVVAVDRPPARSKPVVPLFRSMTRLPLIGWTVILVPAGRRLSVRLVRLIRFRPLSASPRRALAAMCGSLRWSRRTTVRARDP
jgi:hypothetical protein